MIAFGIVLIVLGLLLPALLPTFASGAPNEPFAVTGSSGYLELCVNKGNASRVLGIGRGAEVIVQIE